MNTQHRSLLRAFVCTAVAAACLAPALASAGDATKRELSPGAPGPHASTAAVAQSATVAAREQLERLALEAALVDSSAFGQLRMLRDVEVKLVEAKRSAGEGCR